MGIDRSAWLTALADVGISDESDDQAVTIMEFAALLNLNREAAKRRLEALVKSGKAAKTQKRTAGTDGRVYTTVAYRLLDQGASSDVRAPRSGNTRRPRRSLPR